MSTILLGVAAGAALLAVAARPAAQTGPSEREPNNSKAEATVLNA